MIIKNWKTSLFCLILAGILVSPTLIFADQPQGRKDISLYGGKSGPTSCKKCHIK